MEGFVIIEERNEQSSDRTPWVSSPSAISIKGGVTLRIVKESHFRREETHSPGDLGYFGFPRPCSSCVRHSSGDS